MHLGSFGAMLRQFRRRAELTQEALGQRVGYSTVYIGMLERDERRPHRSTVTVLAAALDLSAEESEALHAATQRPAGPTPAPMPAIAIAPKPRALPAPVTSFVGREHDVGAVITLLEHGAGRLLTLTGPGGVGKTRLALRVAETLRDAFAGGVIFVPLASVTAPRLVGSSIAAALGLGAVPDDAILEVLVSHLREQQALLLLDNVEHVVAAAPLLGELLAACPRLVALATSRVPLRLRAEQEFPVAPLALPDRAGDRGPEALTAVPAVALFVQRARQVVPAFTLTESTAPAVAALCRRLDGLPLAIELAAARIRVLSPQALLARLDGAGDGAALRLLGDGARDLPERHRTLRETIDWSYRLLEAEAQALFRRLAVFSGGWSAEAATAVCREDQGAAPSEDQGAIQTRGRNAGASDATLDDTLLLLSTLVDASLVRHDDDAGEDRYAMLETIRAFALEQLELSGETAAPRTAHLRFFLALAEQAAAHDGDADQVAWLTRLGRDLDNLRAALWWSLAGGAAEQGLRLAIALGMFWYWRGYIQEGRGWLDRLLVAVRDRTPSSGLALTDGADPDGARLRALRGRALAMASMLEYRRNDLAASAALLEESLALARQQGDKKMISSLLTNLGLRLNEQGDYARAVEALTESMELDRALGDRYGVAVALSNLGWVAHAQGDYARAMDLYDESLRRAREIGHTLLIGVVRGNQAHTAYMLGDDARAAALYREVLMVARELSIDWGGAICLEGLGRVAARRGEMERATRWWGAADARRAATDVPLTTGERLAHGHDAAVAAAHAALGTEHFLAAWTAGTALPPDVAYDEALHDSLAWYDHAPYGNPA